MLAWLKGMFKSSTPEDPMREFKEKYMKDLFDGIGTIQELTFQDKTLKLLVRLDGLDKPVEITASNIEIAPDGATVKVNSFDSDLPFLKAALNRFATRPFTLPEGNPREGAECARKVLGLA